MRVNETSKMESALKNEDTNNLESNFLKRHLATIV